MNYYTLYNKRIQRNLVHPKIGLWYTEDRNKAEEMLEDCRRYVLSIGAKELVDDFIVVEIDESGEHINSTLEK